jgi:hypothetical protein
MYEAKSFRLEYALVLVDCFLSPVLRQTLARNIGMEAEPMATLVDKRVEVGTDTQY